MDECVREFQRLDLEFSKVKKLPYYLCHSYDCRLDNTTGKHDAALDCPDLPQILTEVQEIESQLKGFLQNNKDLRKIYEEISSEKKCFEGNVKNVLDRMHPSVALKLKDEFPEFSD